MAKSLGIECPFRLARCPASCVYDPGNQATRCAHTGSPAACSEVQAAAATAAVDDPIRPVHYAMDPTPWAVIEAWGLGFNMGNVVKYTARAERKGEPLQDLRKAREYLDHEIARREAAHA